MIYYAVIDTNVLVSALLTGNADAATVQVVDRLFDGDIVPLLSTDILSEYEEVLKRRKFRFPASMVDVLLESLKRNGKMVETVDAGYTLPDMKDLPFYLAALDKRSAGAYLVTGNLKHFPKEPFIVTPRGFLDIIGTKR